MRKKTVIFLCGLIGSGKTTYAISNFRYFTDLDYMNGFAKKTDQINWTKRLLKINDEVCHITTYPTKEELNSFEGINKRFLLVDTSTNQCKTNILIRGRERDMDNIVKKSKAVRLNGSILTYFITKLCNSRRYKRQTITRLINTFNN